MGVNWCESCYGAKTTGWIPRWNWLIEEIRWSLFSSLLKYVVKDIDCKACGGDGYAKPPGWPDREKMERLRPAPPRRSGIPSIDIRQIIESARKMEAVFSEIKTDSAGPR